MKNEKLSPTTALGKAKVIDLKHWANGKTKHNTIMSATQTKSFGHGADAALNELYSSVGATSTDEKMGTLRLQLGGMPNFYAMGGAINEEMKLACLEYEYLQQVGKIDLVLA